jgi:hypothetical protein
MRSSYFLRQALIDRLVHRAAIRGKCGEVFAYGGNCEVSDDLQICPGARSATGSRPSSNFNVVDDGIPRRD